MFHPDRQTDGYTDMTKLIIAFQNFENAQKKQLGTIKFGGKDEVYVHEHLPTSKLNYTGARDSEEVRGCILQT
jgi:hypothetical protein